MPSFWSCAPFDWKLLANCLLLENKAESQLHNARLLFVCFISINCVLCGSIDGNNGI